MSSGSPVETLSHKFLSGGGEMGKLIRSTNWAATALGPPETWPTSLKITTSIMLSTPFPMYIAWGKEYTQLYNDGYRPILGSTKHPKAMGISTRETFAEIWHIIGSMFDGVMEGTAVGFPNFMLPLDRNGYVEECFFDFSYSPISDENGNVGGVLVTVIEVTEKVKALNDLNLAKQELEISQAETAAQRDRLKLFFMEAPTGICILDGPDLIFELVNPSYQQLFTHREFLGKPILEALPEISGQPIWDILQGVYNNNKTFEGIGLHIPLARYDDGPMEDRYFNFIYQPRHDTYGRVDGIMVFVFEVTDMVTAKKLIEESEKRFRTIVEQSPVPMLVTRGEDMIFEEINPPMLELLGKDTSVKGLPIYKVMPELHEQAVMEHLYNTYRTGDEWFGYEQPIVIHRNGKQALGYYNLSYKPLMENDKIVGVLQSAVDVTEQVTARKDLEKAEDTLKLALLAAELGTFDMDLEKNTMDWDDRCRTLFGISHKDPVSFEKDFIAGLHPDDRDRVVKLISNVFNKSISDGDYDVEYRTIGVDDQKVRWVRAMGKVYFDNNDKPLRFIGSVLDITEIKLDELRKNDFIAMVSHELKTPLTSLKAYVQLVMSRAIKNQDNLTADMLSKVDHQVKKMTEMINGFLNVSRLEAGKIPLEKSTFVLNDLIKETVDAFTLTIQSHHITLLPSNDLTVNADYDKIGQVINNLISNAVKYSPRGRLIEITCYQDNNMAVVSVRDEGMGIKPKDINKLFERFYRVESQHTVAVSGFGIGLYICAEIIQHHNGKIWVDSESGKGSTFYFTLPLT